MKLNGKVKIVAQKSKRIISSRLQHLHANSDFNRRRIFRRLCTITVGGTVFVLLLNLFGCAPVKKSNLTLSASPSSAADDLIYFADATGTIHALQSGGQTLWQYSLGKDLNERQSGAAAGDIRIDRLFARSGKKLFGQATVETGENAGRTILFALDANRLLWFKDAPAPEPNGSPLAIGNDALYLAGKDGVLYAFAKDDGRLLWQYQVSLGTIGAPTVGADGMIYVTGARRNLHAVGTDGVQKWVAETKPD